MTTEPEDGTEFEGKVVISTIVTLKLHDDIGRSLLAGVDRELTRELARALHRPAFLPAVPAFLLKTILRENAQMVLDSQRVRPRVLLEHGFSFAYPDIRTAFRQIIDNG